MPGQQRGRPRSSGSSESSLNLPCNEHGPSQDEMSSQTTPASRLSVLKTKAESRALAETVKVWIVELPIKAANDILIVCKRDIPDLDATDLQHLRRFAKPNHLPQYLHPPGSRASSSDSRSSTTSNGSNASKSSSRSRSRMRRRRNSAASTLHLLVCPTSAVSYGDLAKLLMRQPCFAHEGFPLRLKEITVPLLSPTSVEQAQQWTAQYWPTLYRKTNPFGPHPSLVVRSEEEIKAETDKFMVIARKAAAETHAASHGLDVGCVVIERKADRSAVIVAIAGDARHNGMRSAHEPGNTACHAVLRAIGMVARKRVRVASPRVPQEGSRRAAAEEQDAVAGASSLNPDVSAGDLLVKPIHHSKNAPESISASLADYPLTPLEKSAFETDNLIPNGYLCVELEMYMTHEPCLMCSMALVHSRFARCVFARRMADSGGMAGDSGLGYGLFWRSELNWKLLCWEYKMSKQHEVAVLPPATQV